jgi:hypothetical protein
MACLRSLVVAHKARQVSTLRRARHSISVGTSQDLRLTVSFTLFLSRLEGCDNDDEHPVARLAP